MSASWPTPPAAAARGSSVDPWIRVVLGGPDDIDAALEVYDRSGSARRGSPTPPDRFEHIRATLLRPSTWFYVAEDAGQPVGMAVVMPSREKFLASPEVPGLCYLDLVFVVPERWGEGIGALLVDTVIADARGRGFGRIHLMAHDNNARAHQLYASRRFARTGTSHVSATSGGKISEWARDL